MNTYIHISDNMFDKNTEILTKKGWKKINTITNEKIAHIVDSSIKYDNLPVIEQYYDNKMINISSTFFNLNITPSHEMMILLQKKEEWIIKEITAYELMNTEKNKGKMAILNTTKYKSERSIGETKVSLLSIIMSIGIIENNKIVLTPPFETEEDIKYVINILDHLKINYTIEKIEHTIFNENVSEYKIKIIESLDWIYRYLNPDLTPRWNLLFLNEDELNVIFTIINYLKSKVNEEEIVFVSNNEYFIDWYRVLCLHLGLRTRIFDKINFYLGIAVEVTKTEKSILYANLYNQYFTLMPYNDKVYGIQSYDLIVIKSDNKISITGGF